MAHLHASQTVSLALAKGFLHQPTLLSCAEVKLDS